MPTIVTPPYTPPKYVQPISDVMARYESARTNNARINAYLPSANIAFGGTPASGTVGYANASVVTTGYTMTNCMASLTNSFPAQGNPGPNAVLPFKLYGALPYNGGGGTSYVGLQGISHYGLDQVTPLLAPGAQFCFVTDEPKPILWINGYGLPYIIVIDDGSGPKRVVDPSITTLTNGSFVAPSGGGYQYLQLDLTQVGGRKRRTFYLQLQGSAIIRQVGISGVSMYGDVPVSPMFLWMTDSLGGTVTDNTTNNPASRGDAYPQVIRDFMNVPNSYVMSEGGTGFIATNGGLGRTQLQKIQLAATMPNLASPTVVFLPGSVNDASQSPSAITAAVVQCANAAVQLWPNTPIVFVGGSAANNSTSYTNMISIDTAILAGVNQANLPNTYFIPTNTDVPIWQNGGGTQSSPTGQGNADLIFFSNLAVPHFNTNGHFYWGQREAPAIASALRSKFTIPEN